MLGSPWELHSSILLPDEPLTVYKGAWSHLLGRSAHAPTVGGGDYEIFEHPRTTGHTVTSAADTLQQVEALLLS